MKNVVHLRRVHELEPHVMPEDSNVISDFALFWRGIEWFNVLTGFGMYCGAIAFIVGGMFLIATACGHADVVEYVFAVIGRAL